MRFSTKQKKTIDFLKSDEFKKKEDAKSTIPSLKFIIKINEYGLITTGSQEGLINSGYNKDSEMYYRIEERAYLEGIMKIDLAYKFIERFNEKYDKIAFIRHTDFSKEYLKAVESNKEKISTIPITIAGSAEKKEDIKRLYYDSSVPICLPFSYLNKDIQEMIKEVKEVIIIDPKYGRRADSKDGIYNEIIETLKELQ